MKPELKVGCSKLQLQWLVLDEKCSASLTLLLSSARRVEAGTDATDRDRKLKCSLAGLGLWQQVRRWCRRCKEDTVV